MTDKDRLLALINASNPGLVAPLSLDRVDISNPTEDTDDIVYSNTVVQITPKNGSGYSGGVTIHYRRASIDEVIEPATLVSEEPFTLALIVDMINEQHNAFLVVEELEPVEIPAMEVGDTADIIITAKTNCFELVGSLPVSLVYGLPQNHGDLNTLVQQTLPAAYFE